MKYNINYYKIKDKKNNKNDKRKTFIICFAFVILFIIICYYIKKNKDYKETMVINNFDNTDNTDNTIIINNHTTGFFACCGDILINIVNYFNINKKLPLYVDTTQQFSMYKPSYIQGDIMPNFFKKKDNIDITYINTINLGHNLQYEKYKDIDYNQIKPFIENYFSPAQEIIDIKKQILNKYNINVNEYCAIYYRGTDKKEETEIGSFDTYIDKMNELLNTDKNVKFIVQSDSTYFIDYVKSKFSNAISFDENISSTSDKGIHNEHSGDDNYEIMKNFLAIVYIISKCKYIICSSGNCSIWIMYFRGNGYNVKQFLHNQWY